MKGRVSDVEQSVRLSWLTVFGFLKQNPKISISSCVLSTFGRRRHCMLRILANVYVKASFRVQ